MIEKPMLASTVTESHLDALEWPLIGSPKIDGIRCLNHPTLGPVTRSFKPVPNRYIREELKHLLGDSPLDGELVIEQADRLADFNTTQSGVMTSGGQPEFAFLVFDHFAKPDNAFTARFGDAVGTVNMIGDKRIRIVEHTVLKDCEEFYALAEENLSWGYEGTMLRDPEGPYKNGRSTLKQQWLLKYKEWEDAEGIVIGFEERMHNANEDIKDNFGYAKRTSHKENMIPMDTLGALILHTSWGELRVGTGFDDTQRQTIWSARDALYRQIVTFKYQVFGMQEKPRFPVFKGFRGNE